MKQSAAILVDARMEESHTSTLKSSSSVTVATWTGQQYSYFRNAQKGHAIFTARFDRS